MAPLIPEGMVDVSEPTYVAREKLAAMGFDYGVVCDGHSVVGTVETTKLEDSVNIVKVGSCFKKSVPQSLPCDITSISELIKILISSPFQLVAHNTEIVGVVTESDLNRHPVYAFFYFLLSGMEQNLFKIIRRRYPTEDLWSGFLKNDARKTARKMRQKAVDEGLQLDLIHYLFLPQYVGIISNAEDLIREFGFAQMKDWSDFGRKLGKFRNDVMHPVKPLVGGHRSVQVLAELEETIRRLSTTSKAVLDGMDSTTSSAERIELA